MNAWNVSKFIRTRAKGKFALTNVERRQRYLRSKYRTPKGLSSVRPVLTNSHGQMIILPAKLNLRKSQKYPHLLLRRKKSICRRLKSGLNIAN